MNNFREWLSDNLRYILLIIVIVAVLIGIFFGVRAVSRGTSSGSSSADVSSGSSSSAVSAASSSETASETDHGELAEETDGEVYTLISDYYAALSNKDVDGVRSLVDTLSEEEAEKIEDSALQYSDVRVYTKNGYDENGRVVFASYNYIGENQPEKLPGLAQMYVRKGSDGAWKIIFGELTEQESAYVASVGEDQDVQDLIAQVKEEYDSALSSADSTASEASENEKTTGSASDSGTAAETGSGSSGTESSGSSVTAETGSASGENTENSGNDEENESSEEQNTGNSGTGSSGGEETETKTETAEETEPEEETYRDTAILSDCYVRSGPGYEYEILTEVSAGTKAVVIGDIDNGWWHVYAGGVYGYVGRSFIQ